MADRSDKLPGTAEPVEGNCNAKNRAGRFCSRTCGWGTPHYGQGRCRAHGGLSPIKTGRYSNIQRPRLKELLEQLEADPDPLNLLPEVQLLRALVMDYVERYEKYSAGLLAWHESYKRYGKECDEPRPHQIVDILAAGKFISDIGGLVDKIQKHKREGTVTLDTLNRVLEQLGVELVAAAQETLTDADARAALLGAVERRWATVRLDVQSGPPRPAAGEG